MNALKRLCARIANFAHRRRGDARLQEELRAHLIEQTDEYVRCGMPPAEARRLAALKIGPLPAIRESYHAEEGMPIVEGLFHDLRFAARLLRKSPGFTLIAVTSLALAIGANTTIFSVARQLLFERLAVPHPNELRILTWIGNKDRVAVHDVFDDFDPLPGGLVSSTDFSYIAWQQLRAHNQVLGDLLALHRTGMNAAVGEDAQRVGAHEVSGNYYAVLGIQPQLGRAIELSDDTPASQPVAVISDEFWTSEFARSPAAIGAIIKLNDKPVTVIGVNPKNFTGVESTLAAEAPSVTVALSLGPVLTPSANGRSGLTDPTSWGVNILGRQKPGMNDRAAQASLDIQLAAIVRATMPVRQGEEIPRLVLRDGSHGLLGQRQIFARPLSVLMLFVALVLVLACANITNLMLARGAQRQREMSVRLALGAGRVRILRQMLIESLLLACLGGAAGLAIAWFGRSALSHLAPGDWHQAGVPLHFDWQVFAFTSIVTLLVGIAAGLAPALAATRAEASGGFKEGTYTATRRRKGPAGKALVVFQIALSTLLVIGAGLFIRSLAGLHAINPGFRTDHLLLAQIPLPQNRYPGAASILFEQRLEQAFANIPGVESVSPVASLYLSDDQSQTDLLVQGEAADPARRPSASYNVVGTHFFATLGIPIVAGRAFGPMDATTSPKVAVINQALARTRFPNQNPIGKRFSLPSLYGDHGEILTGDPIEIIGVCADTLYASLHEQAPPQFFLPYVQQTQVRRMSYDVRTSTSAGAILPQLRGVLHNADPELPLVNLRTQQQQIDEDLEEERLFVTLTSGFGTLALLLASVGIYGVMAYSVAQRTNEMGIRLALGALPRQVLSMVLREAAWVSAAGIAAGIGGSILLTRLVASMLYGIAPGDPATVCGAASLLLIVALAASWIPARRAARVQPMDALRRD